MILPKYSYNKYEGFDFSCTWWSSEADPDCYYDSILFYIDKETDGELDFDDISDCREVETINRIVVPEIIRLANAELMHFDSTM